jgi:anti-sigma regulatory factor (Ser/Thr protein kinase)
VSGGTVQNMAQVLVLLPHARGVAVTDSWRLRNFLELGPLTTAVPCARLHVRAILREWHLIELCETAELVASELVTNAVQASQQLADRPSIWLALMIEADEVLIAVWDANPKPVEYPTLSGDELPDPTTDGGRGLFLVEHLASDWGVHYPQDVVGKVVWAKLHCPYLADLELDGRNNRLPLPQRTPHQEPMAQYARLMDDLALLRRVRDGLRQLD